MYFFLFFHFAIHKVIEVNKNAIKHLRGVLWHCINGCKMVTMQLSNDLKSFTLQRESFTHRDGKHLTAADFHRSGCSRKSDFSECKELNIDRQKKGGIYGRGKFSNLKRIQWHHFRPISIVCISNRFIVFPWEHFYSKYTLCVNVKSVQHENIILPSLVKVGDFLFLDPFKPRVPLSLQ